MKSVQHKVIFKSYENGYYTFRFEDYDENLKVYKFEYLEQIKTKIKYGKLISPFAALY